jgi:hypothetical protein
LSDFERILILPQNRRYLRTVIFPARVRGFMGNKGFVKVFLLLIIIVLLGVIGYLTKDSLPFGFTEIAHLSENPNIFEGQRVKIKGEVVDTLKIPLIDSKSYVLDDGTGEVKVITNLDTPKIGSKIAIIGIGSNAAIIGGESIGFRIREVEILPETALLLDEWTNPLGSWAKSVEEWIKSLK